MYYFEDVPKGVEAAANAGIEAIVLTTTHQQPGFDSLENTLYFSPDFTGYFFEKLIDR